MRRLALDPYGSKYRAGNRSAAEFMEDRSNTFDELSDKKITFQNLRSSQYGATSLPKFEMPAFRSSQKIKSAPKHTRVKSLDAAFLNMNQSRSRSGLNSDFSKELSGT